MIYKIHLNNGEIIELKENDRIKCCSDKLVKDRDFSFLSQQKNDVFIVTKNFSTLYLPVSSISYVEISESIKD